MGESHIRVVVYGSSLYMAGIAVSLRGCTGLEVVCLDPSSPTAREQLNDLNTGAIAFDLNNPSPGLDFNLLREHPGLLLIGVDSSRNELLVFSSHSAQALSINDLVKMIQAARPSGDVR